jgi:hypothetical protein
MPDTGENIRNYIRIKTLPGPEYQLWKMLKEEYHIENMQEMFIVCMLYMYNTMKQGNNRQIVINIVEEWRNNRRPKDERRYEI